MIHVRFKTMVCGLALFFSANCLALDYSVFSNQELYDLKDAVSGAEEKEQEAYRREWQQRLETMSEEEKQHYTAAAGNGPEETGGQDQGEKTSVIIPGKGYEKGAGAVIYGGVPAGGQGRKNGGGQGAGR